MRSSRGRPSRCGPVTRRRSAPRWTRRGRGVGAPSPSRSPTAAACSRTLRAAHAANLIEEAGLKGTSRRGTRLDEACELHRRRAGAAADDVWGLIQLGSREIAWPHRHRAGARGAVDRRVRPCRSMRPPPGWTMARRRRLKPWAIGGAVAVALVTGSVALSYPSLFRARTVEVEGEERPARAGVMCLAQVDVGTNVLHLDEGVAEARLEEDPWIPTPRYAPVCRAASRSRSVNAHRCWCSSRGPPAQLAAADGTVLGRAPKASSFPEVSVPQGVTLGPAQAAAAADVAGSMPPASALASTHSPCT